MKFSTFIKTYSMGLSSGAYPGFSNGEGGGKDHEREVRGPTLWSFRRCPMPTEPFEAF